MAIKKGLGKGLDALLGDYQQPPQENVKEVDVYLIDTNSSQPRKSFDKEKLDELANSIKNHGIVQPIVVRRTGERYTIVAGERRYRAARIAGLDKVPVVVKDMDDYQVMEVALIENIQREDLNPIEEATAIRFLMDQNDLTQEEVAERLAKSRPSIANTLRLLNLPEEIQQYLKDGKLQPGHAKVILSLPEKPMQFQLADRIAEGGVSVREAERLAKAMLQPGREKKKPEQPVDTDLKFAEDRLRDRLGTKVSIQGSQSK
ncbi:MAG: ParB/RepB/Spo0J family partition protein, partial [Eubacteriales bacterium]|nr:ParB/RepB/Spo0J family partition protein [Eubacteriales bacterium]